ncbi:MAG: primosomal protein N', partial [Lachnospiraceae bacterium]|nr:primosomal protein N' [Lachnospiraceae bacterium]
MYAEVVVGISIDKLDKTFCYRIPESFGSPDTLIGTEVIVPFGRGNRETKAFVVEVKENTDIDKSLVKDILRKSETGVQIEGKLIKLAYWLKSNYGGTVNEALRSVLQAPRKIERIKERTVSLLKGREEAEDILREFERKKYTVKAKILRRAIEGDFNYESFIKEEKASSSAFNSLTKDGIIEIKEELLYRKPVKTADKLTSKVELNAEQRGAVDKVVDDYRKGINGRYLLFGITGSGKTEVYMEIMEEVISQGKQVIFLIPEIALSFQMVERLSARFGERISIMNSRMSQGERYDQYLRAKNGDIDIIVGPRSALFTPFEHLGLIIVDEEHEGSYKSSKTPRYHAREVALYRAKEEGAAIILGSATPSLEAVKLASDKEIEVLMLGSRPAGAIPPEIEVTDLREELKAGNKSIISRRLSELIKDRLTKGEQTILFINRRGYAGFISCRSCGEAVKCPHCDVSLTFHRPDRLVCHYCGYEEKMPDKCPKCSSPYIGTFGLGTEKVEEIVKKDFPAARVLRMDGDTTTGKNGHEAILESFKNGEADILIGTQMIVKGHDFEKVSLVGILA